MQNEKFKVQNSKWVRFLSEHFAFFILQFAFLNEIWGLVSKR